MCVCEECNIVYKVFLRLYIYIYIDELVKCGVLINCGGIQHYRNEHYCHYYATYASAAVASATCTATTAYASSIDILLNTAVVVVIAGLLLLSYC